VTLPRSAFDDARSDAMELWAAPDGCTRLLLGEASAGARMGRSVWQLGAVAER